MSKVLWISVTRQRSPGVRVSPGVAHWAFQSTPSSRTRHIGGDGGQHSGFPAEVAVAVGGGVFLAQLRGQRTERQQAQDAHYDEHQRLHPERIGEQAGEQGGGCTGSEPDAGHGEGGCLHCQKNHNSGQPEKWNRIHKIPSLCSYYRVSPWGKVKLFLLERCAENEIKNKISKKQSKMQFLGTTLCVKMQQRATRRPPVVAKIKDKISSEYAQSERGGHSNRFT